MHRRIFLMSVAGALAGCSKGRLPRLNVFNWDNYVARDTISHFEGRYRCQVRYGVYASAEEMLAKVMSGNSGWDVVFPSNSFVQAMREMRLLLRLDHGRLPGLVHLAKEFRTPSWDPQLQWCVPYMHGATGILFNKRLQTAPLAWADLWDKRDAGRITMLDDPAEVFAACLRRLKKPVNDGEEGDLRSAESLAMQQKPLLRAYLNEEVRDQVITGDVLAAQMWSQVSQLAIDNAAETGVALQFSHPAEGYPLYADNACILRESRHTDLAYQFLDYLLEPEVAARIASEITGATTNAGARALLPQRLRDSAVLFPSADVLARGEWFRMLTPAAQRLRDRYWTEIKSA